MIYRRAAVLAICLEQQIVPSRAPAHGCTGQVDDPGTADADRLLSISTASVESESRRLFWPVSNATP